MNLLKRYGLVISSLILSSTLLNAQTGSSAAGASIAGLSSQSIGIGDGTPVAVATSSNENSMSHVNQNIGSIKFGGLVGTVTVVDANGVTSTVDANSTVSAPLTVITDGESSVILYLSNGAVIEIKPGSRVQINHFSQTPFGDDIDPFQRLENEPSGSQVSVRVLAGEIVASVPSLSEGSNFLISTPTSEINVKDVIVVVDYNATTAGTTVSNVGGSGTVAVEVDGAPSTQITSGQALNVPGQIDPATGNATASGQPVLGNASSSAIESGNKVANTPPASNTPSAPSAPVPSAPAVPGTTPETDLPDLINPTSTEPNSVN